MTLQLLPAPPGAAAEAIDITSDGYGLHAVAITLLALLVALGTLAHTKVADTKSTDGEAVESADCNMTEVATLQGEGLQRVAARAGLEELSEGQLKLAEELIDMNRNYRFVAECSQIASVYMAKVGSGQDLSFLNRQEGNTHMSKEEANDAVKMKLTPSRRLSSTATIRSAAEQTG
eukprot:TRINITY_DN76149_c0_g1_i1.p1 TRINITY_DN76149_c0_g1~~TRINITY_DN76149_c0_g1_i1.p1  ORF type:complete len:176 (+),score=47.24 TRINITY_DN76149_c0_g1_i1:48-575(+)